VRDTVTTAVSAELDKKKVTLVLLCSIAFETETVYAWSGAGKLVWNGNTYIGVGTFGQIGQINETVDVEATGTTVQLSGIPTQLLTDVQSGITYGGKACIYLGFLDGSTLLSDPIPLFIGLTDKPDIDVSTDTCTITIAVESRMQQLNRNHGGRYTDQDQRARYPNDQSLKWVQYLQDRHFLWK